MSHIPHEDTAGDVDPGAEHPQQPSWTAAIGLTCSKKSTLRKILLEAESQAILQALQYTGWNRKRAAALLKISYRGLLYKINRHSIAPPLAGD